jgi:presenilin-like A22 family membrane protease
MFPRNGGRILPHTEQRPNEATRYIVLDRDGNTKRILFVSPETGRVFEDLREKNQAEENDTPEKNSIRLGLGDFIFYSILVSKAALYSFTTFAACTLAILTGLGLTLLLLAVYGKALPALPISIFLGVVFYLISRYSMEPWIQEIFIQQGYV